MTVNTSKQTIFFSLQKIISIRTFPPLNTDSHTIYTVTYFDDYDFAAAVDFNPTPYTFTSNSAGHLNPLTPFKNQMTGRKVRILNPLSDMNKWLETTYYYDYNGRLIQELGNGAAATSNYDKSYYYYFTGELGGEVMRYQHQSNKTPTVTWKQQVLGQYSRLLENAYIGIGNTYQEAFSNLIQTANYQYNDRQLLSEKNLHAATSENSSPAYLQSVDYTYNIRGWLTSINQVDNDCETEEGDSEIEFTDCSTKPILSLLDVYESFTEIQNVHFLPPKTIKPTLLYLHDARPTVSLDHHITLSPIRYQKADQLVNLLAEEGRYTTVQKVAQPVYKPNEVVPLFNVLIHTPVTDYSLYLDPQSNDPTGTGVGTNGTGTGGIGGFVGIGDQQSAPWSDLFEPLQDLAEPERLSYIHGYKLVRDKVRIKTQTICRKQFPVAPSAAGEAGITGDPNGQSAKDLFALSLHYNHTVDNLQAPIDAQYNGNISALQWQTPNDCEVRGYGFAYDDLNRLTTALQKVKSGSQWTNDDENYSVPEITYDVNGNIETLIRLGKTSATQFGFIDDLAYEYDGNRLLKVSDAAQHNITDNQDFIDGVSEYDEYSYDENGNMITDVNKKVFIGYNHLNLPQIITKPGPFFTLVGRITNVYDALGNKVAQVIEDNAAGRLSQHSNVEEWIQELLAGDMDTETFAERLGTAQGPVKYYFMGFEYTDNVMEAFYHEEGRIKFIGTNGRLAGSSSDSPYQYEYTLTDHLGNGRVYFTDSDEDGIPEVLQENHYYPFGMTIAPLSQSPENGENKYQYNGKEHHADLGLHWTDYGARWYDAQLGRWHSVDPLAEAYHTVSPFNYVLNNPIFFIDPDGQRVDPSGILNGGNQELIDAFNLFANSEAGTALLARFAEKGQTIGGHTFEADGDFHAQGIDLSFGITHNYYDQDPEDQMKTVEGVNGFTDTKENNQTLDITVYMNGDLNFNNSVAENFAEKPDKDTRKEFILSRTGTFFHEMHMHATSNAIDYTQDCKFNCSNIPNTKGLNTEKTQNRTYLQHIHSREKKSHFNQKLIPAIISIYQKQGSKRSPNAIRNHLLEYNN